MPCFKSQFRYSSGDTTIEKSNTLSDLCKAEALPVVDFTSTVTNGTVSFFSETERTDSLRWRMGDGGVSTEKQPIRTYRETGIYKVYLIGYNCYGTDTICKEITIEQLTSTDFYSNSGVKIYPTVTTSQLYIKQLTGLTLSKYSIYNLSGKLVASAALSKRYKIFGKWHLLVTIV